jgi:surface antigen
MRQALALTVVAAMLAGCTQPGGRPNQGVMQGGGPNKQDIGTIAGAIGGGVLGAQIGGGSGRTAAIIGGTLLGAALGNSVGQSLDRADMQYYNQTSQSALESGQPGQAFPWQNPQSGNSGVIVPSNYYQASNGQYCREYTQKISVGGKTQEGYGTACRQPDGSWKIVE